MEVEAVDFPSGDDGNGAEEASCAAGGLQELYFKGDSFERNSRRLGSKFRRGSLALSPVFSSEEPQNQPIMGVAGKEAMRSLRLAALAVLE